MLSSLIRSMCMLLCCIQTVAWASDQIPGEIPPHPVALVGATIHTLEGPPLVDGVLIFNKGKIVSIGQRTQQVFAPNTQVIDLSGKHIYPAMIAANTQMGLTEIGAVRATRDMRESGTVNPNVRAAVSVNPDSELIPVARTNGIGLVQTTPTGGLVSGTSAVIQLDGWTIEDALIEDGVGIHINWPRMSTASRNSRFRRPNASDPGKRRNKQLQQLDDLIAEARAYSDRIAEDASRVEVDLRFQSLLPLVRGEKAVMLHANRARDIRSAIEWSRKHELKAVLVGGHDAPRIMEYLAASKVPIIYGPVHRLPGRRDFDFDDAFAAPAKLHKAGIQFALANFKTDNARNLPYNAATAVAFGLPMAEAIKAVTLYPAQILGVADRVGSLKKGKHATLIITDGNPLEITTKTESMWLGGAPVDLSNRQTMLYKKYSIRLGLGQGK